MDAGTTRRTGAELERAPRLQFRPEVPHLCLFTFALLWLLLAIAPWERGGWPLENILTAIAVPPAIIAFGLLMLSACRELFFRPPAQVPFGRQLGLSIAVVASFGGAYEAIEWLTAIVAEPAAGTAFLGTQGDVWEAQKDFVCATSGAVLGSLLELRHCPRLALRS